MAKIGDVNFALDKASSYPKVQAWNRSVWKSEPWGHECKADKCTTSGCKLGSLLPVSCAACSSLCTTIVKMAKKYYTWKPWDSQLAYLFSWCLVCLILRGEGQKIRDQYRWQDGPKSSIDVCESMQTQKNIHIFVIILRLWWYLISWINLDKSEWIVYLNKTSQMACVILRFSETEMYFIE